MLDLITISTFVSVLGLVWLLAWALFRPRPTPAAASGASAWTATGVSAKRNPFVESLAGQLPQSLFDVEELDKDIRRAGYYRPRAKQRYLALRNGLVILVVLATGAVAVTLGPERQKDVFWALGLGATAAVLCYALPRIILAIQAQQRVERIRDSLPDAMDTINMCLQGGISFQECLSYVGQEMMAVHPDLGLELLIVGQQTDINSFDFAIQQFATRIDAPEIVAMASLVTQNQRLGAGIIDSIRDFADSLRLKRRQITEAKAGRTELYLLFPVVFCLVPSILLLLWGPPVLEMIDFLSGPNSPLKMGM
jgi:tight adherence protein C